MKKYLFLVLAAIAIIAISGCTQRSTTIDANNGLKINEFSADPLEAESNDLVSFLLEVENVGGTTAKDVVANLYGVQNQWIDTNNNVVDSTLTKEIGTLKPPDITRNIPGDFKMVQWTLRAPRMPEGTNQILPITARITYIYNTTGSIVIKAFSDQQQKIEQNLKKWPPANPFVVTNTNAPIKIDVPTRYQIPIIVDTTKPDDQTEQLRIEFVNKGNGWPVTENVPGRMYGTIRLFGPAEFSDCLGVTSGNEIGIDENNVDLVKLKSTGNVPVACEIKINKDQWGNNPEGIITMTFEMYYLYYLEQTAPVRVIGIA